MSDRPKIRKGLKEIPELLELIENTEHHLEKMVDGSYHEDNDDSHFIYEAAMTSLYGGDIFKWINRRCDEIGEEED